MTMRRSLRRPLHLEDGIRHLMRAVSLGEGCYGMTHSFFSIRAD